MSFGAEIAQWASETQVEIAEESAQITRLIFKRIVQESPHKTGRFIGNWHIGPTSVSYSVQATSTYDQKQSEINAIITDDYFLINKEAHMVNNVSYAQQVEEDGWRFTDRYAPVSTTLGIFNAGD